MGLRRTSFPNAATVNPTRGGPKRSLTMTQAERVEARRAANEEFEPVWVAFAGARWFVGQVISGSERGVADDLIADGWRAYSPIRRDVLPRARLVGGGGKRGVAVRLRAVFPGYIFIGAEGVAPGKSLHDKLLGVIGSQGAPLELPGRLLEAINFREMAGEWDALKVPSSPVRFGEPVSRVLKGAKARFSRGETVRIVDGVFAGLNGIVAELPVDMRVTVELALFGRATPTQFEACQIECV